MGVSLSSYSIDQGDDKCTISYEVVNLIGEPDEIALLPAEIDTITQGFLTVRLGVDASILDLDLSL